MDIDYCELYHSELHAKAGLYEVLGKTSAIARHHEQTMAYVIRALEKGKHETALRLLEQELENHRLEL